LFFGLVSTFLATDLLAGSPLAKALLGLMALWWLVRLLLQFTCFDRSCIPAPDRHVYRAATGQERVGGARRHERW